MTKPLFSSTGHVLRIYSHRTGTYIRLSDTRPGRKPKAGYFLRKLEHPNYAALHNLALSAALHQHRIRCRAFGALTDAEYADVAYMVIDFDDPGTT